LTKGLTPVVYYQLSPHVFIEFFDEDAVMLVADRDVIITVNQMAAQIFQHAREMVGNETFNRSACVDFLLENYQLSGQEAAGQMRSMLGFGLRQGLILKNHVA
jgi:hypothetical protein